MATIVKQPGAQLWDVLCLDCDDFVREDCPARKNAVRWAEAHERKHAVKRGDFNF